MDYTSLSIDSFVLLSQPSLLGCSVSLLLSLIYYRVVYLSTHFLKYFNLFSIFLLGWYIFTFFDIFRHIFCLFQKKKKERAKGAPLPGIRVTSHACIRQKPCGLSADDGCRRIKSKKLPLPGEQAPQMLRHALSAKSPNGLSADDGCRRNKPKKEPVWLASYQTGSFLVLIRLVTRQTGYYTGLHRNRPVPGGFHGCPVR